MIYDTKRLRPALTFTLMAAALAPVAARADDAKPPATWISGITFGAQLQAGVSANTTGAKNDFGQLFTDKANTALINQLLLTVQRQIDPKETGWDVGFKLQLMEGTDARYTHFLGELTHVSTSRYQTDIVEANITIHAPVLTEGGIDAKIGQYPTPIGYETIDPSTNPFYSHSYIFNFGIPLKHTGGYAIVHATPMLDVYLGVDTGVNTSFGAYGDNNSAIAGLGGVQLTLLDGKLTILALTHIGSETATRLVPNADNYMRYLNDAVVTWKATDALTLVTELNYIRDDFAKANGGGVAQYASYTLTDTLTLNGRAEVWADGKNFFVAAFPGNSSYVNAEEGLPATVVSAPANTTYGALTLGVTYKPPMPAAFTGLLIRPEIRYDSSLNGTKPFNGGKDTGALTFASDFVLTF
jgi:hypothetical protein